MFWCSCRPGRVRTSAVSDPSQLWSGLLLFSIISSCSSSSRLFLICNLNFFLTHSEFLYNKHTSCVCVCVCVCVSVSVWVCSLCHNQNVTTVSEVPHTHTHTNTNTHTSGKWELAPPPVRLRARTLIINWLNYRGLDVWLVDSTYKVSYLFHLPVDTHTHTPTQSKTHTPSGYTTTIRETQMKHRMNNVRMNNVHTHTHTHTHNNVNKLRENEKRDKLWNSSCAVRSYDCLTWRLPC